MDCDMEEYQCSVAYCTVFDPVNISPTKYLFDRNTVETLQEKNPRSVPRIPQTRAPFLPTDIIPDVALREKMRKYYIKSMGSQYTGWEVIPEYPQLLFLPAIRELLVEISDCFPNEQVKLREMSEESWSNAWKRLNYLRLNLQILRRNRYVFLMDERCIKLLGEIISRSYTRSLNSPNTDLFHRECLRMIRVLDMSTDQLRDHLKPQDVSQRSRFIKFLARNLQCDDKCFHSLALRILSILSSFLNVRQVSCVIYYLHKADAVSLSSTNLRNIANILHTFYAAQFSFGNIQLPLDMLQFLMGGLVQMFEYLQGLFGSEDRLGVVEDAVEALRLVLFLLSQLLNGAQQLKEPALAWSADLKLLGVLENMMRMEIGADRSPALDNLTQDHWLLLFTIAHTLYAEAGTCKTLKNQHFRLFYPFRRSRPVAASKPVKDALEKCILVCDQILSSD